MSHTEIFRLAVDSSGLTWVIFSSAVGIEGIFPDAVLSPPKSVLSDHSVSSSIEVKNAWSCISTPIVPKAWPLINYGDKIFLSCALYNVKQIGQRYLRNPLFFQYETVMKRNHWTTLQSEGLILFTVCGEVEALELALDAGANPSTPDIHGGYPIHYAAQMCGPNSEMGNDVRFGLAVLRKLLARGVEVNVRDKDGRQPILWAASAG